MRATCGTAEQPGSVADLVALLGYQPAPGLAATGTVAAIRKVGHPAEPLVIPAGMPLASQASAGVPSQTFETGAAIELQRTVEPPGRAAGRYHLRAESRRLVLRAAGWPRQRGRSRRPAPAGGSRLQWHDRQLGADHRELDGADHRPGERGDQHAGPVPRAGSGPADHYSSRFRYVVWGRHWFWSPPGLGLPPRPPTIACCARRRPRRCGTRADPPRRSAAARRSPSTCRRSRRRSRPETSCCSNNLGRAERLVSSPRPARRWARFRPGRPTGRPLRRSSPIPSCG